MKLNSKSVLRVLIVASTLSTVILLLLDIILNLRDKIESLLIIILVISLLISLSSLGILLFLTYKIRIKSIDSLVDSINSISGSQEESFEVGIMIFDDEQTISFISPWMQKEGFDKYLGKNISKLNIDIKFEKTQTLEMFSHFWKVIISKKSKTILFKDWTTEASLIETIELKREAILAFHFSFSKKINFNEQLKSEAYLTISKFIQEWTNDVGGIFESPTTTENTLRAIVKWEKVKQDVETEYILSKIKKLLGKYSQDITISIGLSFGDFSLMELSEKSFKSLEIAKNRGGDQIVIEAYNGEIIYVGNSSIQTTSSTIMNIRKFYTEFQEDIKRARKIFITSHNFADLDAVGSALGLYEMLSSENTNIYIVLDTFDTAAKKYKNSLPINFKSLFISEGEALKLMTKRTHVILIDTSSVNDSQAPNVIKKTLTENISVIDHHRIGKKQYDFLDSKLLIETTISSIAEIVIEMFKLSPLQDGFDSITPQVATGLLSGIHLDTKQLTKNVTNSTFDAVSFLMRNQANVRESQLLFSPPKNFMKIEAVGLKNLVKISKGVVFTHLPENMVVEEETTSIFADKLLKYEGIEASFVLAKVKNNKFKVSMRSNSKINVQIIAEFIGGGGHFNAAAATWPTGKKFNTVKKKIINAIQKGIK